jgi:hypothetical protein
LDATKRQLIISILANGSSRRVAAQMAGCAASTIQRTAERDPEFAAQIARAEQNLEIEALRNIRNAGKDPRHWRASAWTLERRNPHDFAPRSAECFSVQEFTNSMVWMMSTLCQNLSQNSLKLVMRRLDQLIRELHVDPSLKRRLLAAVEAPQGLLTPPVDEPAAATPISQHADAEFDCDPDDLTACATCG